MVGLLLHGNLASVEGEQGDEGEAEERLQEARAEAADAPNGYGAEERADGEARGEHEAVLGQHQDVKPEREGEDDDDGIAQDVDCGV